MIIQRPFFIAALLIHIGAVKVQAQNTFEAQYEFGDYASQFSHPASPDGAGGGRVCRAYPHAGANTSVAIFHVNGNGQVMSALSYSNDSLGMPWQSISVEDSITALICLSDGRVPLLMIDNSEQVIRSELFIIPGATNGEGCSLTFLNGNFYLAASTLSEGAELERTVTVMKIDRSGHLLASRTYWTEAVSTFTSIGNSIDGGLLLAGAAQSDPAIAVVKLDTELNVLWSIRGPAGAMNGNVVIRPSLNSDLVIWGVEGSGDGGLMRLDPAGSILQYKHWNTDKLGDVVLLSDGGFLMSSWDGLERCRIRRYGPDGEPVWQGSARGVYRGNILPCAQPGTWAYLSGQFTGAINMNVFDEEGTCAATHQSEQPVPDSIFIPTPLSIQSSPGTVQQEQFSCTIAPIVWTRTVNCGTLGVTDTAPIDVPMCRQIASEGSDLLVDIGAMGTVPSSAIVLDMLGRTLPLAIEDRTGSGTIPGHMVIHAPSGTGMGILRLSDRKGYISCKLHWDNP